MWYDDDGRLTIGKFEPTVRFELTLGRVAYMKDWKCFIATISYEELRMRIESENVRASERDSSLIFTRCELAVAYRRNEPSAGIKLGQGGRWIYGQRLIVCMERGFGRPNSCSVKPARSCWADSNN